LGETIELKGWKGYRAGLDVNGNWIYKFIIKIIIVKKKKKKKKKNKKKIK